MGRCIVMMTMPVITYPQFSSYCFSQPLTNFNVVLFCYCLTWRSIFVVNNTFIIKMLSTWPWHYSDFVASSSDVAKKATSTEKLGFCFRVMAINPQLISSYDLFEEMCITVRKSTATSAQNSFCCCDLSCGTSFATTCFIPRSCIKICETIVCGIPRSSNSCTVNRWFLFIAPCTHSKCSGVLLWWKSIFKVFVPQVLSGLH